MSGPDSTQVAQIYQLQAAFHLAKRTQSIDLMMSLWDVNGSLTIPGGSALGRSAVVAQSRGRLFWRRSGEPCRRDGGERLPPYRFPRVRSLVRSRPVRSSGAQLHFDVLAEDR